MPEDFSIPDDIKAYTFFLPNKSPNPNEEYLSDTYYAHPCAHLNTTSDGLPNPTNLYGIASFLVTTAYCAHQETNDNGAAARLRIKEILDDWLTEERERNLYLRHHDTLVLVVEEIAERLFAQFE